MALRRAHSPVSNSAVAIVSVSSTSSDAGLRDLGERLAGARFGHRGRPPRARLATLSPDEQVPLAVHPRQHTGMTRLAGKVALITGAGNGMGRAASLLFAGEGARVVVADALDQSGHETVEAIADAGGEAAFVHVDVTDENEVAAMVEFTVATFGGLDVLYNNAGIMPGDDGGTTETGVPTWDRVMAVNLRGVWLGCKHGIPAMVDSGGGSIVNVASFVALMGAATPQIAYTASKGGVLAMTPRDRGRVGAARHPLQRALPGPGRHAAARGADERPGVGPPAPRAHPDGPAGAGRGAGEGGAVPRVRRLVLHDRLGPGRRRRDHRRLRDPGIGVPGSFGTGPDEFHGYHGIQGSGFRVRDPGGSYGNRGTNHALNRGDEHRPSRTGAHVGRGSRVAATDEAAIIEADRQQLHSMGYAQELRRGLGTFSNFAISFSIISVLAGALTTFYLPLIAGGPAAINTSWIVIGFFALIVGMAMAEICSAMPTAGGLYYWSAKLAKNEKSGARWSWFTGWFNLLGQIGVIASVDYALSVFIGFFVSLYATSWFGMPILDYKSVFIIYTLVLITHGLLNTFGVGLVKRLMDISVWWHVFGVLVIVVALHRHPGPLADDRIRLLVPLRELHRLEFRRIRHLHLHHRNADRAVHHHGIRRVGTRERGDERRQGRRTKSHRPLDLHLGDRGVDPELHAGGRDPEGRLQEPVPRRPEGPRRWRRVADPGTAADLRAVGRGQHVEDDHLHRDRRAVLLRHGVGDRELADDLRVQP